MADAPKGEGLSLRFCFFAAAVVLYAFLGSPTPDSVGLPEILTGILLILSASPRSLLALLTWRAGEKWRNAGQVLLLYALTVPLAAGLFSGHSLSLVIRDVIPFLFFLLPLFMLPFAGQREEEMAVRLVALTGIVFSLRILLPMAGQFSFGAVAADPLYLSIAPTVCFAALLCAGMAGRALYAGVSPRRAAQAAGYAALALLPFAAMAVTLQRASIGLSALALGILFSAALFRAPVRALPVLLLAICAALVAWVPATDVAGSLLQKHGMVGMNMRMQEAAAVSDTMDGSVWQILFGRGWGATFSSPAVGGVVINYTHSLPTALWMKTGLIGAGLAASYLALLLWALFCRLWSAGIEDAGRRWIVTAAIAVPFLIDTFLYASYKSLDFGLILLLSAVYGACRHCAGPIPGVSRKVENP